MIIYLQNWKNAHQLEILLFFIIVILTFIIVLKEKCSEKQFKRYGLIVSCIYVIAVFYVTVLSRETNKVFEYNHELFWSYKLVLNDVGYLEEIGLNILLFVPFGIIWSSMVERRKKHLYAGMLFVGGMISASIEIIQYSLKCGFSEVDDVISNVLGVAVGVLIWNIVRNIKQNKGDCANSE